MVERSDRVWSTGEGDGKLLHYSCLENPMNSMKRRNDQLRQHIKKQRHYFTNKGLSSQSYGFPIVMYGCESWTIKIAEG